MHYLWTWSSRAPHGSLSPQGRHSSCYRHSSTPIFWYYLTHVLCKYMNKLLILIEYNHNGYILQKSFPTSLLSKYAAYRIAKTLLNNVYFVVSFYGLNCCEYMYNTISCLFGVYVYVFIGLINVLVMLMFVRFCQLKVFC